MDDREKNDKTGKVRQGVMAQGRTPTKSCSQEMRNCGRNQSDTRSQTERIPLKDNFNSSGLWGRGLGSGIYI